MTALPDIHALTGPYVLNAADDNERAAFEQHLATCTDCSAEINDLRESITRLSLYVARQPPAPLKLKVTTAATTLRQLPPTRPHPAGPRLPLTRRHPPGLRLPFTRRQLVGLRLPFTRRQLVGLRLPFTRRQLVGLRLPLPRRQPAGSRIVRRSLTLAAALLAIATSGAVALDQYRDNTATTAISTRAATILSQPDTRTIHGQITNGGQATVILSPQQDAAVVLLRNLRPLTGRKTYQLWLLDAAHNAKSIGLTNGKSPAPTVVPTGLTGKVAFSVTIEPRGGSPRPTPPTTGQHPAIQLNTPTT